MIPWLRRWRPTELTLAIIGLAAASRGDVPTSSAAAALLLILWAVEWATVRAHSRQLARVLAREREQR